VEEDERSWRRLELARRCCHKGLRKLVNVLLVRGTAQVMAANEKVLGMVQKMNKN
jgi:hypothetical protein